MGTDSFLVNTLTNEIIDVRGFSRFSSAEIQQSLTSRVGVEALVATYTNRSSNDPVQIVPYKKWLADLLIDFSTRGNAKPTDIFICSDDQFGEEPSWYKVIDTHTQVSGVHDFDPDKPTNLYPHPPFKY